MKYEEILPVTNVLMFKKELWLRDYIFRLEKWFKGKQAGPVRINAEITRRCNSNCIFCSRRRCNGKDYK
jgi:wyosine [tRNA(Phe)-imidazoG37] synthetase (radical SAM superfamily)